MFKLPRLIYLVVFWLYIADWLEIFPPARVKPKKNCDCDCDCDCDCEDLFDCTFDYTVEITGVSDASVSDCKHVKALERMQRYYLN